MPKTASILIVALTCIFLFQLVHLNSFEILHQETHQAPDNSPDQGPRRIDLERMRTHRPDLNMRMRQIPQRPPLQRRDLKASDGESQSQSNNSNANNNNGASTHTNSSDNSNKDKNNNDTLNNNSSTSQNNSSNQSSNSSNGTIETQTNNNMSSDNNQSNNSNSSSQVNNTTNSSSSNSSSINSTDTTSNSTSSNSSSDSSNNSTTTTNTTTLPFRTNVTNPYAGMTLEERKKVMNITYMDDPKANKTKIASFKAAIGTVQQVTITDNDNMTVNCTEGDKLNLILQTSVDSTNYTQTTSMYWQILNFTNLKMADDASKAKKKTPVQLISSNSVDRLVPSGLMKIFTLNLKCVYAGVSTLTVGYGSSSFTNSIGEETNDSNYLVNKLFTVEVIKAAKSL